jgi:IMP dehydrogenase/GMP reductase
MSFIDNAKNVSDSLLIVGNVATAEAANELATKVGGIAAIKVGIGPGAACTTREVTGFGVPQLTAIMDVADALRGTGIKIIADGGIKSSGDIVKALAAGADTVMLGRLLAGADESPHPGLYWGMASYRVNGHHAPEGVEGVVERTGPVGRTIKQLAWGIKSGVSYGGGTDLDGLRRNAEFVRVTPLSMGESGTRL